MIGATMTDKTVNTRFFTRFFKVQIAVSPFFKIYGYHSTPMYCIF